MDGFLRRSVPLPARCRALELGRRAGIQTEGDRAAKPQLSRPGLGKVGRPCAVEISDGAVIALSACPPEVARLDRPSVGAEDHESVHRDRVTGAGHVLAITVRDERLPRGELPTVERSELRDRELRPVVPQPRIGSVVRPWTNRLCAGWKLSVIVACDDGRDKSFHQNIDRCGRVGPFGAVEEIGDQQFPRVEVLDDEPPSALWALARVFGNERSGSRRPRIRPRVLAGDQWPGEPGLLPEEPQRFSQHAPGARGSSTGPQRPPARRGDR
jgi:hypothetical protein